MRPVLFKPLLLNSYLTFPLMSPVRQFFKNSDKLWWLGGQHRDRFHQVDNRSYPSLVEATTQGIVFRLDPLMSFDGIAPHVNGLSIVSCSLVFLHLSLWETLGPVTVTLSYDNSPLITGETILTRNRPNRVCRSYLICQYR